MLTAADVKEVCGYEGVLAKDPTEGASTGATCDRWMGSGSAEYAELSWRLWRAEAAAPPRSYEWYGRSPMATIEVAPVALGDRAEIIHDHTPMDSRPVTLRVQRGGAYLVLRMGGSRHACNDDELVQLAKRVLARLPPS
jgi:hypothetical protein